MIMQINKTIKSKPITKVDQHNVSVTASTGILSSDLSPTNTPCIFRIYVVPTGFTSAPTFSVIRKVGATSYTENLNSGSTLSNDTAYIFDILVGSDETINFQCDQAGTLSTLLVAEYYESP